MRLWGRSLNSVFAEQHEDKLSSVLRSAEKLTADDKSSPPRLDPSTVSVKIVHWRWGRNAELRFDSTNMGALPRVLPEHSEFVKFLFESAPIHVVDMFKVHEFHDSIVICAIGKWTRPPSAQQPSEVRGKAAICISMPIVSVEKRAAVSACLAVVQPLLWAFFDLVSPVLHTPFADLTVKLADGIQSSPLGSMAFNTYSKAYTWFGHEFAAIFSAKNKLAPILSQPSTYELSELLHNIFHTLLPLLDLRNQFLARLLTAILRTHLTWALDTTSVQNTIDSFYLLSYGGKTRRCQVVLVGQDSSLIRCLLLLLTFFVRTPMMSSPSGEDEFNQETSPEPCLSDTSSDVSDQPTRADPNYAALNCLLYGQVTNRYNHTLLLQGVAPAIEPEQMFTDTATVTEAHRIPTDIVYANVDSWTVSIATTSNKDRPEVVEQLVPARSVVQLLSDVADTESLPPVLMVETIESWMQVMVEKSYIHSEPADDIIAALRAHRRVESN